MKNNPNLPYQSNPQMMMPNGVPYISPTIPLSDLRQPTAEEIIKKVVADVKAEKEKEKSNTVETESLDVGKCDLHPKKLSNNCRKCKKIKEKMDEIEKKKQQEKERTNPENRLREILNTGNHEDVRNRKNPDAPMAIWGDSNTFNVNELLRNNIKSTPYFNELFNYRTIQEIADEINKKAMNAEPWVSGHSGIPSTFFCCLLRLMMMRLSENQVRELLDYSDGVYVRCAGLLFLRYTCNPEYLWDWFKRYLLDEEEVHPVSDPNVVMSLGEYAEMLLTEMNYYNTLFPRIPLNIDREIKKNILMMKDRRARKRKNQEFYDEFVRGAKIMAISPEDNDWHEATLVRFEGRFLRVKFTNLKEKHDDADFTLELLAKKFQGEDVFMGGDEVLVDLGEVMAPSDAKEYLRTYGGDDEEEEEQANVKQAKPEKMDEEDTSRKDKGVQERKKDAGKEKKRRKKSSSSSSSGSSSSSRSTSRSGRNKKDRRRTKKDRHRSRKNRSSSDSSRSGSSSDDSRSRKKKNGDRKRKERERRKEKERRKERSRRDKKSSSSSSSSSESRSKSKSKEKEEVAKKVEKKKKPEVKVKGKTDKYMERVLQMQAESATASSKAEYAARPISYKTSLSTNLPGGNRRKQSRSSSPNKVVVMKKEGRRRDDDEEEKPTSKQQLPSAEAMERLKKLREQYGDSSGRRNDGGGSHQNRDLDEGPDVLKLGN